MREIKFRGRRLDNGEWVYGFVFMQDGKAYIITDLTPCGFIKHEVDPATVGLSTGMKDKNGREVYEGDIINWLMYRMDRKGYIEEGRVEFRTNEQATVVINKLTTRDGRESVRNILNCSNDLKVVGNIHDNPELLKTE